MRPDAHWSVSQEYPLAFQDKNLKNIRVASGPSGEIVSHAVLKPTVIKTPYHVFKVGVIGSVCTAAAFRGKGYGRSVIQSCLQEAKLQDCDIAVLWSDKFPFYEKMGFQGAGTEVHLSLPTPLQLTDTPSRRCLESAKVSAQSVLNLFNRHSLCSFRSVDDIQKHLRIPNSKVYTAWSLATGQLEAYLVVGKGADFPHYVHEWGGNVSAVIELIAEAQKSHKHLSLISPPSCQNLIRQLKGLGATETRSILGLMKVVHPENLCKRIKKGARALGYENFVFEHQDGVTYFGATDDIYQTNSLTDLIHLIFGPAKPESMHSFSEQTLEMLNDIFPIPFWIWGWDSI